MLIEGKPLTIHVEDIAAEYLTLSGGCTAFYLGRIYSYTYLPLNDTLTINSISTRDDELITDFENGDRLTEEEIVNDEGICSLLLHYGAGYLRLGNITYLIKLHKKREEVIVIDFTESPIEPIHFVWFAVAIVVFCAVGFTADLFL